MRVGEAGFFYHLKANEVMVTQHIVALINPNRTAEETQLLVNSQGQWTIIQ